MIFVDSKTKKRYKSPNHNDDKKLDDWHNSKGKKYKEVVMSKVEQGLKDKYGSNADIAIVDGKIHLNPRIDKYRGKGTIDTGLTVEGIFHDVYTLVVNKVHDTVEFESIKVLHSNYFNSNGEPVSDDIDDVFVNLICICHLAA